MNKIEQFKKWMNEETILYMYTSYDTTKRIKICKVWDGSIFGNNAVIKIIIIDEDNNKTGELTTCCSNIKIKYSEGTCKCTEDSCKCTEGTYDCTECSYEISILQ